MKTKPCSRLTKLCILSFQTASVGFNPVSASQIQTPRRETAPAESFHLQRDDSGSDFQAFHNGISFNQSEEVEVRGRQNKAASRKQSWQALSCFQNSCSVRVALQTRLSLLSFLTVDGNCNNNKCPTAFTWCNLQLYL